MTMFASIAIVAMLLDPTTSPSASPTATAALAPPDGTYTYSFRSGGNEIGTTIISVQRSGAQIQIHEAASLAGKPYTLDQTLDAMTLTPINLDAVYPSATPTKVHATFSGGTGTETIAGTAGTHTLAQPTGTAGGVVLDGPLMSGFFMAPAQTKALNTMALAGISPGSIQEFAIRVGPATASRPSGAPSADMSMTTNGLPSGDVVIWYDPSTLVPDELDVSAQSISIVLVKHEATVSMTAAAPAAPTPLPMPAARYTSRDVSFAGDGGTAIAGTLTVPDGMSAPAPAVVMVAGSGPVDRDERVGPNPVFLEIANALSNAGFVVLRYDKPGVGKSGGTQTWTHDELVADARAAVGLVDGLPQVDRRRVFALGHSEGGILVPDLATRGAPLHGIALLAPPAIPLDQILVQQAMHFAGSAGPEKAKQQELASIAQIKARTATSPEAVWLRSSFGIDPAQVIKNVPCPIFIAQGGKDFQVLASDLPRLVDAAKSAHRDVTAHVYPDDDHLFITLPPSQTAVVGEYLVPHQVDPAMLSDLIAWLKSKS